MIPHTKWICKGCGNPAELEKYDDGSVSWDCENCPEFDSFAYFRVPEWVQAVHDSWSKYIESL